MKFALQLLETMMKNCGDLIHFHVIDREILQEMSKIVRKRVCFKQFIHSIDCLY